MQNQSYVHKMIKEKIINIIIIERIQQNENCFIFKSRKICLKIFRIDRINLELLSR